MINTAITDANNVHLTAKYAHEATDGLRVYSLISHERRADDGAMATGEQGFCITGIESATDENGRFATTCRDSTGRLTQVLNDGCLTGQITRDHDRVSLLFFLLPYHVSE